MMSSIVLYTKWVKINDNSNLWNRPSSYTFTCWIRIVGKTRSPPSGACNYPVKVLSQTDIFLAWIYLEFTFSVTNCNHKQGLVHALFNPYRSVLMYTGTGLYRGKKISKNWLVGNYTVALAYYASCRILVMGSGKTKSISILSEFALLILTLVLTGKSFQLIDWKSHKYPVIHLLRCTKKAISCLFLLCTVLNKFQLVITNCSKLVETSPEA